MRKFDSLTVDSAFQKSLFTFSYLLIYFFLIGIRITLLYIGRLIQRKVVLASNPERILYKNEVSSFFSLVLFLSSATVAFQSESYTKKKDFTNYLSPVYRC